MEPSLLPTEVILTHPPRSLGNIHLDWNPQPGTFLDVAGQTYTVLERHHRYQLKAGRYRLHKIALYVQAAQNPSEKTWVDGQWILGDATCRYNAHSALLRCAINPEGPCDQCRSYEREP